MEQKERDIKFRERVNRNELMLVSNNGPWELDNFEAMLHLRSSPETQISNLQVLFPGPMEKPMRIMLAMGAPVKDVRMQLRSWSPAREGLPDVA